MIVNYANDHELKWRDDSSNSETKYQRNKIRHTIIPAFETLNQAFIQNALNTAKRIEQTGKLFDLILKQVKESVWSEQPDRILINLEKLKEYPAHDMILFELLKDFGAAHLSQDMLLHTIESVTGKQFHTHSHTFTRDRENLIITSRISKESTETIIDRDTMILNYPIRLYFNNTENLPGFRIPHDRNIAALDADKINYPLLLRGWKKGDRFYPLGLKGSKKISDFLINIKLPLPDKKHVWILESEGKIVWLVNHRIDNRFKVTPETRKILLIDYKE
jgi:tRNA(Ile)-lysidine synthase